MRESAFEDAGIRIEPKNKSSLYGKWHPSFLRPALIDDPDPNDKRFYFKMDISAAHSPPLWEPRIENSAEIAGIRACGVPLHDFEESIGNKSAAGIQRGLARDFYDLMTIHEDRVEIDIEKVQAALAMRVIVGDLDFALLDKQDHYLEDRRWIRKDLFPKLRKQEYESLGKTESEKADALERGGNAFYRRILPLPPLMRRCIQGGLQDDFQPDLLGLDSEAQERAATRRAYCMERLARIASIAAGTQENQLKSIDHFGR